MLHLSPHGLTGTPVAPQPPDTPEPAAFPARLRPPSEVQPLHTHPESSPYTLKRQPGVAVTGQPHPAQMPPRKSPEA